MTTRKVLVTGAAGFIGAFLVKKLLEQRQTIKQISSAGRGTELGMMAVISLSRQVASVKRNLVDSLVVKRKFRPRPLRGPVTPNQ